MLLQAFFEGVALTCNIIFKSYLMVVAGILHLKLLIFLNYVLCANCLLEK